MCKMYVDMQNDYLGSVEETVNITLDIFGSFLIIGVFTYLDSSRVRSSGTLLQFSWCFNTLKVCLITHHFDTGAGGEGTGMREAGGKHGEMIHNVSFWFP